MFAVMLLSSVPNAFAVDEEVPPPAESEVPAPQGSSSRPSTNTLSEDDSLPSPSLGDNALPEPSADRGQENSQNQVNRPPEDDEIFLPTPNVNDNINYAPVGTPSLAPRVSSDDRDWRYVVRQRPAFSLYGGMGSKSYANSWVQSRIMGPTAGLSIRVVSLAQTVFAHVFGAYSWYGLGNVGSLSEVREETLQVGGMLEIGIGRSFSVFGTILRRNSRVSAYKFTGDDVALHPNQNLEDAAGVGDPGTWLLGVGAQWDFYVIPHGSIGLHAHLEQDLFSLTLAVAMEPVPRKKMNLNFDEAQ